jgi:hypothetical protein
MLGFENKIFSSVNPRANLIRCEKHYTACDQSELAIQKNKNLALTAVLIEYLAQVDRRGDKILIEIVAITL